MKVYICIKEKPVSSTVHHMGIGLHERISVGDLFCEPKGKNHDYLKWDQCYKKDKPEYQSYVWNNGYPKDRPLIEDNPEYFKLLIDDQEHDTDYYITKKYSQYELDQIIKNA